MEFYTAKYTYRLDFSGELIYQADEQDLSRVDPVFVNFCPAVKLLTSYEADKRDNGEAAADQALPPLRNRVQVRFLCDLVTSVGFFSVSLILHLTDKR